MELEIDPRTGMKVNLLQIYARYVELNFLSQNYMASDGRGWDTSTAHIRRTFRACIDYGRRSQGREGPDLFEAYRLLGSGLHTMEDLLAHSNWCEIALRKMGHKQVFCHVGDAGTQTPSWRHDERSEGDFLRSDYQHTEWTRPAPRHGHIRECRFHALYDGGGY